MSPTQFRKALDKLEMTQTDIGKLLRLGDRTPRRWALEEARIPFTAEALMKLMVSGKITPKDLETL